MVDEVKWRHFAEIRTLDESCGIWDVEQVFFEKDYSSFKEYRKALTSAVQKLYFYTIRNIVSMIEFKEYQIGSHDWTKADMFGGEIWRNGKWNL